jgi:hypothetical protein
MTRLPASYDAWRLRGLVEFAEPGTEPGDTCGRCHEPDEDAPRGYRPRPCNGVMADDDGDIACDTCGETP